ncbi:MAG: TlpA disulfide reductase family protein [Woeseia sp.]
MKNFIAVALLIVASAAAGYFLYGKSVEVDAAPTIAFTLPDLQGNPRQFSEWAGKARLVNFWATWCAPCRREIPLLKKTQTEHGGDNLQVIGIAVDFPDQVSAYAESAEFNYPILVGQEDAMAAAESTGMDFIGLPFTMIVSSDGYLIKTHIGEMLEQHVALIVGVLDQMQSGELDLNGARAALKSL